LTALTRLYINDIEAQLSFLEPAAAAGDIYGVPAAAAAVVPAAPMAVRSLHIMCGCLAFSGALPHLKNLEDLTLDMNTHENLAGLQHVYSFGKRRALLPLTRLSSLTLWACMGVHGSPCTIPLLPEGLRKLEVNMAGHVTVLNLPSTVHRLALLFYGSGDWATYSFESCEISAPPADCVTEALEVRAKEVRGLRRLLLESPLRHALRLDLTLSTLPHLEADLLDLLGSMPFLTVFSFKWEGYDQGVGHVPDLDLDRLRAPARLRCFTLDLSPQPHGAVTLTDNNALFSLPAIKKIVLKFGWPKEGGAANRMTFPDGPRGLGRVRGALRELDLNIAGFKNSDLSFKDHGR
jgi:hypothetical protein